MSDAAAVFRTLVPDPTQRVARIFLLRGEPAQGVRPGAFKGRHRQGHRSDLARVMAYAQAHGSILAHDSGRQSALRAGNPGAFDADSDGEIRASWCGASSGGPRTASGARAGGEKRARHGTRCGTIGHVRRPSTRHQSVEQEILSF